MQEHKLHVMDVVAGCGAEAVAAVDKLGYRFLADNGYPEAAGRMDSTARDAIRKKMSKRAEKLHCHGFFDGDLGQYIVWFTLRRGKKILATSSSVRFQGVALDAPIAQGGET